MYLWVVTPKIVLSVKIVLLGNNRPFGQNSSFLSKCPFSPLLNYFPRSECPFFAFLKDLEVLGNFPRIPVL